MHCLYFFQNLLKDGKIKYSELGAPFRAEFRAFPPETETFADKASSKDFNSKDFKSRRTHWAYAYGCNFYSILW